MEAVDHLVPDVGAQAVAEGQAQLVRRLLGRHRQVGQVAAKLADVDELGAALLGDVAPEVGGRELALEHYRAAVQQRRAQAAEAAGGVVERQGDVDPVVLRGARRPGERPHVELGAHVGDAGGLGQAGGAAGEDVEGGVAGLHALAHGAVGTQVADAFHGLGQVALAGVRLGQGPLLHVVGQQFAGGLEGRPGVGVHQAVPGAGDVQAVGQGLAGKLVVDQCGGDADLGKAEPDGQVLQAVGHEQRHHVAAVDANVLGPVGVAVGHGVQLAVGQREAFKGDGAAAAPAVDGGFQVVADQVGRIGGDAADAVQGARQPAQEAPLPFQTGRQTHPLPSNSRSISRIGSGAVKG